MASDRFYIPNASEFFSGITCHKRVFFFSDGYSFLKLLRHESLGSLPRRRPKGDSGGMFDECDEKINVHSTELEGRIRKLHCYL